MDIKSREAMVGIVKSILQLQQAANMLARRADWAKSAEGEPETWREYTDKMDASIAALAETVKALEESTK